MRKIKYFFVFVLLATFFGLAFFMPAMADEEAASTETSGETVVLENNSPPPEVAQDMQVTTDDLGAKKANIKPDSIWHPFKRFGRAVQEAITFNPIKDAELKLKHANQELSEIKQLIDEKGIDQVDLNAIADSTKRFEKKLEKIKDISLKLKERKGKNPIEIENLLDNLTDKQFKEQKILEQISEEITEVKGETEGTEEAFSSLKDIKGNALNHFGEVLMVVDDSEKISERLASIADKQKGSEFKLIKTAEILKKLEEEVAEDKKEIIEKAQEKTLIRLQESVKELTPIVRAEKFRSYTHSLPGDETVHLSIFEDLKQMPDIPQDMLEKIEEVKEFAAKRFEEKISKFSNLEIRDRFFEDLHGDNLDDIMVLEELKSKITAKQGEIRMKIEQEHQKGIGEFKRQFTDTQSQDQATRFEKLIKEMTTNPNPKTLRLIDELEKEVAQSPEKKAFIENIKNKTKVEFETKFRQEGGRFFDRIGGLNPQDMMVFREFEEDNFFDPAMVEQFLRHQTESFKDHMQNINEPENFDRFSERFRFAPPEVINAINTRDQGFGEMMQFKARKMDDMMMKTREIETRMKMDAEWQNSVMDFERRLSQVQTEEEKKALFEEKQKKDLDLVEKQFSERQKMMEERIKNDPWCDKFCQEIQRRYFDQELAVKKQDIMNESKRRDFELEMKPGFGFNPFENICNSPEECMSYCEQNPSFQACQVHRVPMPPPFGGQPPFGESFPGRGPMDPPPHCPPGEISISNGDQWNCSRDPYWQSPQSPKNCPPGHFWNEKHGFCEFDQTTVRSPMPVSSPGQISYPPASPHPTCGPNEYWDDSRGCREKDFPECPADQYFDFFEKRCKTNDLEKCPYGKYWDTSQNVCVEEAPIHKCPVGYFWNFSKEQCMEDLTPIIDCFPGEYWDPQTGRCEKEITGCPSSPPSRTCQPNEMPIMPDINDPCGQPSCSPPHPSPEPINCPDIWEPVCGADNSTYPNECRAKQARITIQYWGECQRVPIPPTNAYCGDKTCNENEDKLSCPTDCGSISTHCGDGICNADEDKLNCPNDCVIKPSSYCGDKICSTDESSSSCSIDCGGGTTPPSTGFCGDNVCDSGETSETCYSDCGPSYYCGDGTCDSAESQDSCSIDCGAPPATEGSVFKAIGNFIMGFFRF